MQMKIRVTYRSGCLQDFVVSEDILHVDFMSMAKRENDRIAKVDFL